MRSVWWDYITRIEHNPTHHPALSIVKTTCLLENLQVFLLLFRLLSRKLSSGWRVKFMLCRGSYCFFLVPVLFKGNIVKNFSLFI